MGNLKRAIFWYPVLCSNSARSACTVHPGGGEQDGHRHPHPPPLQRDGGALRRGGRQHGVEGDRQVQHRLYRVPSHPVDSNLHVKITPGYFGLAFTTFSPSTLFRLPIRFSSNLICKKQMRFQSKDQFFSATEFIYNAFNPVFFFYLYANLLFFLFFKYNGQCTVSHNNNNV